MSKPVSAPRAVVVLAFCLLTGCASLDPNAWRLDAAQMTPITTTNREPTCPAPAAAAATAALRVGGSYSIAGPLDVFFLRAPRPAAQVVDFQVADGRPAPAATPVLTEPLADEIDRKSSNVPGAMAALPPKLQDDKVIKSILNLAVTRKYQMMKSVVANSSEASLQRHFATVSASAAPVLAANTKGSIHDTGSAKQALTTGIDNAAAKHVPNQISIQDIKTLHQALVSQGLDRGMQYASYYFSGTMADRFGAKLAAPTFTGQKVTDADIGGLLTALLESAADDALQTPIWVGATADDKNYYPGGSTVVPSALYYAADGDAKNYPNLTEKLVPLGCGMTTLKAEAIRYLANDAAAWATSGTGLIVGLFGGVNLGIPFALGKVSIGDNQTLQTIVQTLISFAAKRGSYEAIWPRLYAYNQTKNDRLADLVKILSIISPAESGNSGTASK
jgi:hypothetical protein